MGDDRIMHVTSKPASSRSSRGLGPSLRHWIGGGGADLPEIFAVGGSVRDHLLERSIGDVDITCPSAEKAAGNIAASRPFRTTTIILEKKPHAPCFRVVNKNNPSDFIDVVEMHGNTIEEDLCRRDFTINAMAAAVTKQGDIGDIMDPLAGRDDLAKGCIRCCRPDAFAADPLRMLRAVRIAADLNFTIPGETFALMKNHADKITASAFERITGELFMLLARPHSFAFIQMLDQTGLLDALFPEIHPMKGCRQNAYHHLDVWDHSMATLANCETIINDPHRCFPDVGDAIRATLNPEGIIPVLKLAALFHDAGKPGAIGFDEKKQRTVFYGHADIGQSMAAEIADRLRLSTDRRQLFTNMVKHHMWPHELAKPKVKKPTVVRWFRKVGDLTIPILILAAADSMAKQGGKASFAEKDRLMDWINTAAAEYFLALKPRFRRPALLTGRDLMNAGMAPGPAMGNLLRKIRMMQDEGVIGTREAALEKALELMKGKNR
ncbi:MAG: HD domain-containing protein [Thermodesulfobacteriota bacterium]|nr:HD domain-containing protein [Thermodesulfobacteriota bacterium]